MTGKKLWQHHCGMWSIQTDRHPTNSNDDNNLQRYFLNFGRSVSKAFQTTKKFETVNDNFGNGDCFCCSMADFGFCFAGVSHAPDGVLFGKLHRNTMMHGHLIIKAFWFGIVEIFSHELHESHRGTHVRDIQQE